jgi:putative FmdB family regulatory protein
MPLYEYQCESCGVRFERLQRKSDRMMQECPDCGGSVRRLLQPPGLIFKGSGFYVTDNRRSTASSRRSGSNDTSESSSSSASDSKKAQKDSD